MRTFASLMLLWVQVPAPAAEPVPTQASGKLMCESRDLTFDSKEIGCLLQASSSAQRLRLTVSFSGGHDDTSAAMTVYVDDKVLACDAGSKLRLMGEDGEISLTCMFTVSAAPSHRHVLKSVVNWSHAQYTGFSLESD